MKNHTKKLIVISMLGIVPVLGLNAQSTNRLMIPQYDNATLQSAGCDPNNWNKLVNNYVAKRGYERQLEASAVNEQVLSAPLAKSTAGAAGGASCFQSAVNNIDNAMNQVNAVMALYGGFDFSALGSNIMNQLGSAACNQLNYQVGQATGFIPGAVNGAVGNANGAINQNLPIGNINIPRGNINVNPNNPNNGNNGNIGNIGNWFQNINPFR